MTKLYPYNKYLPHLIILRASVMIPLLIAYKISEFVYQTVDKIYDNANHFLPEGAEVKWVEFEKLPPRRQKSIEALARIRDVNKEQIHFSYQGKVR